MLGPLEAVVDGRPVPLPAAKPRALLGLLVVRANQVVAADRLIEDLWEGDPPMSAAGTLQSHISALRRALGSDRLHTRGRGYLLEVAPAELDAALFEAEEQFAAGDRCVVRWRYEWGDSSTPEPHHVRGIDVFRVRDGLVAEKVCYVKG